jgi:hypothetical protein
MAEIIPSAIKDDNPGQIDKVRTYRTIQVASRRGIRTVRVREDRLKQYGRLDYQGREVYAKKVKVVKETATGMQTETRAVNPRVLQRSYTRVPSGEYKKYQPSRSTTITTKDNRTAIVTEKEIKEDWRYAGRGRYERIRPGVTTYRVGEPIRPRAERREQAVYREETGREPPPPARRKIVKGGLTYFIRATLYTLDGTSYNVTTYRRTPMSMDYASLEDSANFRVRQSAFFMYGIQYDNVGKIEIDSIEQVYLEST